MTDSREVPDRSGRGELRERASRFLAFALPTESGDEALLAVERLRREYHDSTHVPFAWRIGLGEATQARCSDAGEPRGTAGRPIAAAIEAAGVTNVLVVVVRYFGGTKLGTGGLARAYRESAARALARAGSHPPRERVRVRITCGYEAVGSVRRLIRPPEVTLLEESFGEDCAFQVAVLRARLADFRAALEQARLPYRVQALE